MLCPSAAAPRANIYGVMESKEFFYYIPCHLDTVASWGVRSREKSFNSITPRLRRVIKSPKLGTMSCGDDKDEPKQSLEEQLIGSWVGDVYELVDGEVIMTYPHSHYMIFNADHTGKSWMVIDGVKSLDLNFNWSLNGNILTNDKKATEAEISIKDDVLYYWCPVKQGVASSDKKSGCHHPECRLFHSLCSLPKRYSGILKRSASG